MLPLHAVLQSFRIRTSSLQRERFPPDSFLLSAALSPWREAPGPLRGASKQAARTKTLLWTQLVLNEPVEGEKVLSGVIHKQIEDPEKVPDAHLYS